MFKKIILEIDIIELKKFLDEQESKSSYVKTIKMSLIQETDQQPNDYLIRKYSEELEF